VTASGVISETAEIQFPRPTISQPQRRAVPPRCRKSSTSPHEGVTSATAGRACHPAVGQFYNRYGGPYSSPTDSGVQSGHGYQNWWA
jgi:hypothetical protein